MFYKEESSHIQEQVAKHLRTLLLEGETCGTLFSNFKCLHSLTLTSECYTKFPDSIRELIHLRYLNISSTRIENLPEWIGELHHLQTLRTNRFIVSDRLPSSIKYLINLRHLYLRSGKEIGKLTSLQTLQKFEVGTEKGYKIEELESLNNLKGTLKIKHLERVCDKEEAMKANVLLKSNISNLALKWDEDSDNERNDKSVLEGLQPHANLKILKIKGFKGKTFPTWCKKMAVWDGSQCSWVPLDNLIEITLMGCLECEEIPMLEHLPNLKTLFLVDLKKLNFINSPSFKNLKTLIIYNLEGLQCLPELLFYNNQSLSNLWIVKCHVLSELPYGLDTLDSLKELILEDCPNLKAIGNLSHGAKKYQGILRELKIVGCRELVQFPCQILESSAPTIEVLILKGLRSLKNLPMLIDCFVKSYPCLKDLTIKGVPNIMTIKCSSSRWLKELEIDASVKWCRETSLSIIETVDRILQGCCNSFTHLYLKGVENWDWLPQSIQHLTTLDTLELENIGVEELPQWLGNQSSLRKLCLLGCYRLRCLPSVAAFKRLTELDLLQITDCPELHIDSEWHTLPNLKISDGSMT